MTPLDKSMMRSRQWKTLEESTKRRSSEEHWRRALQESTGRELKKRVQKATCGQEHDEKETAENTCGEHEEEGASKNTGVEQWKISPKKTSGEKHKMKRGSGKHWRTSQIGGGGRQHCKKVHRGRLKESARRENEEECAAKSLDETTKRRGQQRALGKSMKRRGIGEHW
ncbi:hypothetical protein NDU88_003143 [Pleurodeles waltl]|uniref:Uncharacterized protein n=1 Tax=Pleurodeles waltl TaxID=8319 RepID=A0AAV7QE21_PLEWA|nr:hypothetical protein NDU88_003143 [Pleurodeles waltl]